MRKWTPVPKHPNVYSYETAKGKRYGIREGYRTNVGDRDEFTKSGFKSWREAEVILKHFESDLALGKYDELASGKITLDQAFKHLVDTKDELQSWRPVTRTCIINLYEFYLKKQLGTKKLKDIRPQNVRRVLAKLADDGLAHATIRSIVGTLSMTLNLAVRDDLLDKNRISRIDFAGKPARKKMQNPQDTQKWLDTAHEILSAFDYTMVMVMAQTGMRSGEVTGLRTDSIVFKTDEIHKQEFATIKIDKQRSVHYPTGGPLKNRNSYRTVVVDGELVQMLKAVVKASNDRRLIAHPKGYQGEHWLWLQINGEICSPTHLKYLCKKVTEKCEINIHPHMFRHYFATQAVASEKPQIDVMHYLGHGSVQMTADYTRPTEHASLEVFRGFEAVTKPLSKSAVQKTDVPPDVPSKQTK